MKEQRIEVLIVGAGPTGLAMAIELHRHDIPFRIIDKQLKPVATSNALAVQTGTLELWDDIGLLPKALALGMPIKALALNSNGKTLGRLNCELLTSTYRFILGLSQHDTETVMLSYLAEHGIKVEMGWELAALAVEELNNKVTLRHDNGELQELETGWLLACDGGHSFIRTQLNIPFVGKELKQHFVLADVSLKQAWQHEQALAFLTPDGPLFILQYKPNQFRIIAEVTNDQELSQAKSLSLIQLNQLLTKRCSFPLVIEELIWTSGFWIHEREIEHYQYKQVFFLGDAAHIHSPAGGQGMNTGIQDANNLAWKLALVINNKAKAQLLASYHQERYPVAKAVLQRTTAMTYMLTLQNWWLQSIRNGFIRYALSKNKMAKNFINTMAQLNINYSLSEWIVDYYPQHKGPKPGSRFIDVEFNHQRLFDHVRGTQHIMMVFSDKPSSSMVEKFKKIAAQYLTVLKIILISRDDFIDNWSDEVVSDKASLIFKHYEIKDDVVYLVRPDKYLCCRARLQEFEKVEAYLKQLFNLE
jgi:2-polyprenyl-6-methoxyphenol hydroxylase-like FAD-dependent oxidoreductase